MNDNELYKKLVLGPLLALSYLILLVGFGILIATVSTIAGLFIVFVGGLLSVITTCVYCWPRNYVTNRSDSERGGDAPPSYRISWNRSFGRNGFSRNTGGEWQQRAVNADRVPPIVIYQTPTAPVSVDVSSMLEDNISSTHTSIYDVQDLISRPPSSNTLSIHSSSHDRSSFADVHSIRSGLHPATAIEESDPPPSYEAALAGMDDESYQRVISDQPSPSICNND